MWFTETCACPAGWGTAPGPSSTGRGPGRAAAGRRQPYSTRRSPCSPPAGNTWTECSCWVTPTPGSRGGPVRTLVNRWVDDLKVPHLTICFFVHRIQSNALPDPQHIGKGANNKWFVKKYKWVDQTSGWRCFNYTGRKDNSICLLSDVTKGPFLAHTFSSKKKKNLKYFDYFWGVYCKGNFV